jgi:hypothetical protein
MTRATAVIDQSKLDDLLGRFVVDLGAAFHATTVVIGDRLGLYRALAEQGPSTAKQLAKKNGCAEPYIREWLRGQAAGGYVTHHPQGDCYSLTPEQAFALAAEDGLSLPGAFLVAAATAKDESKITEAFRTGVGVGWHEHDADLFPGTERFFRPGYDANLVSSWIPALDGVEETLRTGGRVADVGCGHRRIDHLVGAGVPGIDLRGFRLPRAVDPSRPQGRRSRRGSRSGDLRG